MNPTYIIYLLTFLGFPLLGLVASLYLEMEKIKKYVKWILLLFGIYNISFYFGFSIKGDYPDYIIFSLEYLFLSLVICLPHNSMNIFLKIFRTVGTVVLVVGFLQGLIGILLFIVVSQDFEADKIYNYNSDIKNYQTRRYSFGSATLDDTKYTFETYQTYEYFPVEKLIDKTDFLGLESGLNFNDENFKIKIEENSHNKILEFSSVNSKKYAKTIK